MIANDLTTGRNARRLNSFRLRFILAVALLSVGTALCLSCSGQDRDDATPAGGGDGESTESPPENPFPNRRKAPEGLLDGGKEWLNSSGEITVADLRGKIALFDFWTYCCINCMHVLPDLKYLEEKYPNELVVIGVHSAKFDNEKDSENIRRAILRYEIAHPVVNDADMIIWRKFGARAWPTLAMIDPEGYYLGSISGEGHRELLDQIIERLTAYHKFKGTLDETPVRFDLERNKVKPGPLRFPGKVLADEAHQRLFVSDTGHNRIVVATLDGELLEVIGNGRIGQQDGSYESASFNHPHGLTLDGDTLYVADTENHLIRSVDLTERRVSTLAGTGQQARFRRVGNSAGKLRETALSSPWALQHVGGVLYVAMAGPHQIWSHTLGSDTIRIYAGSGLEDVTDGPLEEAAFAQPSALPTDGSFLYVADSEGSAIRKIGLGDSAEVTTVVGMSNLPNGRSLFTFGDVDGIGDRVRLQHPIGAAYHEGTLYIADSYNHKIKKVDLSTRRSSTWLGTGEPGDALDPPQFSEPHGVSVSGDTVYVADTNNHRICAADLQTGNVSVLSIEGLQPPAPPETADASQDPSAAPINLQPVQIAAGDVLPFEVTFALPQGYKLNQLAPVTYRLTAEEDQELIAASDLDARRKATVDGEKATFSVPLAADAGHARLVLAVSFGYCRNGVGGLCKLKTLRWLIPVEVTPDAAQKPIALNADAR